MITYLDSLPCYSVSVNVLCPVLESLEIEFSSLANILAELLSSGIIFRKGETVRRGKRKNTKNLLECVRK